MTVTDFGIAMDHREAVNKAVYKRGGNSEVGVTGAPSSSQCSANDEDMPHMTNEYSSSSSYSRPLARTNEEVSAQNSSCIDPLRRTTSWSDDDVEPPSAPRPHAGGSAAVEERMAPSAHEQEITFLQKMKQEEPEDDAAARKRYMQNAGLRPSTKVKLEKKERFCSRSELDEYL